MRVIIHFGLHKTGSTSIQQFLNANTKQLLELGVFYAPQSDYPAHHEVAWGVLNGELQQLANQYECGKNSNATTLIFSSEDLESLIFRWDLAEQLEAKLLYLGATSIEYVAYVRSPVSTFWSAYYEMAKHTYVDLLQMANDVLRKGYFFLENPHGSNGGCPYWYYCFDYDAFLSPFVIRADQKAEIAVSLYDFHGDHDYLGDCLIGSIVTSPPFMPATKYEIVNTRLPDDVLCEKFANHICYNSLRGYEIQVAEHVAKTLAVFQDKITECLEIGLEEKYLRFKEKTFTTARNREVK